MGGMSISGDVYFSDSMDDAGMSINDPNVNSFSDRRLKRNVKSIKNAVSKVNKLNGVYYNWSSKLPKGFVVKDAHKRKVGIIAQEVHRVLPEAISVKDDYLAVDYELLVPLLIQALKETSMELHGLKEQLVDLQKVDNDVQDQLDTMKKQISAIELILFS